jgi:hypothetical protein
MPCLLLNCSSLLFLLVALRVPLLLVLAGVLTSYPALFKAYSDAKIPMNWHQVAESIKQMKYGYTKSFLRNGIAMREFCSETPQPPEIFHLFPMNTLYELQILCAFDL